VVCYLRPPFSLSNFFLQGYQNSNFPRLGSRDFVPRGDSGAPLGDGLEYDAVLRVPLYFSYLFRAVMLI